MVLPEIIKNLLENGVHFGHLSKHWNPKMKQYIFGKKKNVYIIDLEKTAKKLTEAKDFLSSKAQAGEKILFVATKKQLRGSIKELAQSCNMPYVTERWVGGLLTNFSTVRVRVNRYISLIEKREKNEFEQMSKKEVLRLNREIDRMAKNYSGVVALDGLPGCVCVVDPKKEVACVKEVSKLEIPIVALIDTDANPEIIDYPVPGNDDSIKSVRYIISSLAEAVNSGLAKRDDITAKSTSKEKSEDKSPQPAKEEPKKEEAPNPDKPKADAKQE